MNLIFILISIFSFSASADQVTFSIKGMNCRGCEHELRAKVCMNPDFQSWIGFCEAKVENSKLALGHVLVSSKPGQNFDQEKIQLMSKAITDTGRDVFKTEQN